jgi:enoyl-CoA hydratase
VIEIEYHDRTALVRLNHGKVNALDLELLRAISGTFQDLEADAVVLTGTGRAFSAGVDLKRIADGGTAYVAEFLPALSEALLAVFGHPKPVVAAVNGHAIAGGCVLAAACDVRLMSTGTIGLTELRVGLPFPVAALEIVTNAIGPAAHALALTGQPVDVDTALSIGLVHEQVPAESLVEAALRQAAALGALKSEVYAFTKQQLNRSARERINAWAPTNDAEVLRLWSSSEAQADIAAYLASVAKRA